MAKDVLEDVGKSALIIFVGTLVGSVLNYLTRILIARFFGPSSYGLISMGIALLGTVTTISLLGLRQGITRWISYFIDDEEKIKDILISTLKVVVPVSLIGSIILFLFSDTIAIFLSEPGLKSIIKIFCLAVPFYAILNVFVAGIRGLQNSTYKVYSYDVAYPGSKVILVSMAIFLGFSIEAVVGFYVVAIIFSTVVSFILLRKLFQFSSTRRGSFPLKKLVLFSWPLMISSILFMTVRWFDIFMIGFFKTSYEVGIYNVALPTASILIFPLFSFKYMFMPKTSELFSKDVKKEIKGVYRKVVRWIFLSTFPFTMTMIIFSNEILYIMFGAQYTAGSLILSILALGYFYASFVGPTGDLLIAVGKTKSFMSVFILITVSNFILNIVLIQSVGIVGAAFALTFSFVIGWTVSILLVYNEIGEQPFQKDLIKPFSLTLIISLPFLVTTSTLNLQPVISMFLGVLYILLYFIVIYASGSLKEGEIKIFRKIKKNIRDA